MVKSPFIKHGEKQMAGLGFLSLAMGIVTEQLLNFV
jgi:hypothetical protein